MSSVACIGDIAQDYYVNLSRKQVGGISFNVAWNLRHFGVDARVFSLLGDDADGCGVLEAISQRGMPVDGITVREGETARQRIIVNNDGERIFDGYRTGVLSAFTLRDLQPERLAGFHALHIPLSDGLEGLFDSVATEVTGPLKIADLSIDGPNPEGLQASLERYSSRFDLLFVGGKSEHMPYVAKVAQAKPEKVFVVTLGSAGAVCFRGERSYERKAIPLERVVDTTGCGDGFQGAFIARWLVDRNDLPDALDAGIRRGAEIATLFGATDCVITGE